MLLRAAFLLLLLLPGGLLGEVVRVEIQSRGDVLGGRRFGLAGAYEKLVGRVYFAVDPANPRNEIITDLARAPRNAAGKVEFSSDLYILKPKQPERGNGAVLYEVSNRGRKSMLGVFNRGAATLDPATEADFGDGFLMRQGYTLVWLGWQPDPPRQDGLVRLHAPVASGVRGLVRADFIPEKRITSQLLSDRQHIPYLVADPANPEAVMTVRERRDGPRSVVPRAQWRFSTDRTSVEMDAGFEPHKIYEVIYAAQDPVLVGLGPTAVRDFFSHLKYGGGGVTPVATGVFRAYGFGISQSGRFLRTFLYQGFNEDEQGRQVFDGVMADVAGGGRGSFNHRFAQPSRDAHPFMNFFYPTDIFPFTDLEQTDPETGATDGLLVRARKTGTSPKIFYTNSSYEYWGRAASLTHTTVDGKSDAPLPDNVRIYLFAGGQHGPAAFPPRHTIGQQLANPNDFRWAMRALLVAMDRWVNDKVEPPPSAYPRIADSTLVAPEALSFPKIPGVATTTRVHTAYRVDYGPQWNSGVVLYEPPRVGKPFPMLVPQVNSDGNELAGVRMPDVAVPLATYTGWNLFNEKSGPADELSSMVGSFIPFARTREERMQRSDPRPSIAERYIDRDHYLGKIAEAAIKLADQGYLLQRDVPALVKQAGKRWDYLAGKP